MRALLRRFAVPIAILAVLAVVGAPFIRPNKLPPTSQQVRRYFDACKRGDAATVSGLIERCPEEALVRARDKHRPTPLHFAAYFGQPAVARVLIRCSADINARDNADYTPLHWAAEGAQYYVAELLLASGAEVNARNKKKQTALDRVGTHPDIDGLLRSRGGVK